MKGSLMKLFAISLLLFSVCMFSGCIGEDTDSCPPEIQNNLILNFVYKDDQGADILPATIHKVNVFVFDEGQRLVAGQTIDRSSLTASAAAEMNLPPGTYRIVCWGNAMDRTLFSGVASGNPFSGAFLRNSTLKENNVATNGDALYYAPSGPQAFTVTILPRGAEPQTKTISFCCAHIKIEVYIKGFEDRPAQGAPLDALVELTRLSAGYNFDMQASGPEVLYSDVSSARTIQGQQLAVVDFYTPVFNEDTPTQVLIRKQSDGSILTTINLKDFIKENNIELTHSRQTVIPILVEYKSAGMNITLPGWGEKPVTPELN